ncbi:MAG: NTP transferase domain-containing protein [Actinomycetota bacterium]|nr:NTP transferase domain-containing protein [Actinomycetota bacterium]
MFDAIVLAGGSARRLGGVDKPALLVGMTSLLDRAVASLDNAGRVVVVGPRRHLARDVVWCQEQPPGGGPVAAIAAGLGEVRAALVVVLAADLPAIGPAVPLLIATADGAECAVLTDADGRRNHLAAAWQTAALRAAVTALPETHGAAARELYDGARIVEVADRGGWSQDCDTWADLAVAQELELLRNGRT